MDKKSRRVIAKKDKIVLSNVEVFEKQNEGFRVENTDNHFCGYIMSVPKTYEEFYNEGDFVVLRSKALVEDLVVDGTKYSFVQPIDIICEIK